MLELKMPTRHFQLKHFLKSKKFSDGRFLKKYYIITILIFLERFDKYLEKSKNEFTIVFSNLARPMVGRYFRYTIWVF